MLGLQTPSHAVAGSKDGHVDETSKNLKCTAKNIHRLSSFPAQQPDDRTCKAVGKARSR